MSPLPHQEFKQNARVLKFQQMNNGNELPLERCPHCSVAKPRIYRMYGPDDTTDSGNQNRRYWSLYVCATCGGVIMTEAHGAGSSVVLRTWPEADVLSDSIPDRARIFLKQAMESLHAPSLAQIGAASAVDSMLKDKGLKIGSLCTRIDEARKNNLITSDMAAWAHEVRLDANDQRHADENAPLPTKAEAEKTIEFAKALAQFLFVLPAMVKSGRGLAGTGSGRPATASVKSSESVSPPPFPGTV